MEEKADSQVVKKLSCRMKCRLLEKALFSRLENHMVTEISVHMWYIQGPRGGAVG
jgi:hypothetical protein